MLVVIVRSAPSAYVQLGAASRQREAQERRVVRPPLLLERTKSSSREAEVNDGPGKAGRPATREKRVMRTRVGRRRGSDESDSDSEGGGGKVGGS